MSRKKPGVEPLIGEILRSTGADGRQTIIPRLRGGLCRDRHTLFDLEDVEPDSREYVADRAAAVCFRCPCLAACAEWAAAQPSSQLSGVVAGRVYRWAS